MTADAVGHVALVGLSGSGKSTLAPLLASRLGDHLAIDLDRVVEQRFGRTTAEIFRTEGESGFREAEHEALEAALAGPPAVIATGGGVVLAAENRGLLSASARVVWLRANPTSLRERLEDTTEARPLLAGDADFALTRMSEERDALYAQVAELTIDVEGAAPLDLADEVARALG